MMSHNLSAATAWFTGAAADNTREFWQREKGRYAEQVRAPFLALLADVDADTSAWKVYRPHNDTRFAKDKGPLKTFIGALRVEADGTGRYLQLDAKGVLASSGMPYLAPDQLAAWRQALLDDVAGEALGRALDEGRALGGTVKSGYPEPLKSAPRGIDPDHPRIRWLRWKGIEVFGRIPEVDTVHGDRIAKIWDAGAPLCAWLADHVGASAMERPRR